MKPKHPTGAWSLAAGEATTLQPRRCGHLAAVRGRLRANGAPLPLGERVRVWSGERVQLKNVAREDLAFFTWDYCAVQPRKLQPSSAFTLFT